MNKIAIWSYKGGVGKTSLAYSLAVDLGYNLVTNDMSNVLTNYSRARFKSGYFDVAENTIYDFGGFKDSNAKSIVLQCDILLIPTIADANSLMKALEMLREFKTMKIMVVGNMIENQKDKDDITKVVKHYFPDADIMFIKKGKLFRNALEQKMSAVQMYEKDNLNKHIYGGVFRDYLNLLKFFAKKRDDI